MNAATLDRLLNYGPLSSISCRWLAYDPEEPAIAYRDGDWCVWGHTVAGEQVWIGTAYEEPEAKAFAERVAAYLGVPVMAKEIV